jgi:hypothetical protein
VCTIDTNSATGRQSSQITCEHCDGHLTARRSKLNEVALTAKGALAQHSSGGGHRAQFPSLLARIFEAMAVGACFTAPEQHGRGQRNQTE